MATWRDEDNGGVSSSSDGREKSARQRMLSAIIDQSDVRVLRSLVRTASTADECGRGPARAEAEQPNSEREHNGDAEGGRTERRRGERRKKRKVFRH